MKHYSLHYIDLNPAPAPVEREPHPVAIVAGAALAAFALWALTFVLFTL